MRTKALLACGLALLALTTARPTSADTSHPSIGVVDFRACLEDSKFGLAERNALLSMQKQLATQAESTEKQLTDIVDKLRDPEYLDSLSPDAEQELQMQYQALQQDLMQKQQQFYQIMSQQEMRMMETIGAHIMRASQIVSKEQELDFVVRQDSCFFFAPTAEVTAQVIIEMDKLYAVEFGENSDT